MAKSKLRKDVKYDVMNGVITLKGNVNTKSQREDEKLASSVPDAKQVVNEFQVKNEKASSEKTAKMQGT